MYSYFFAIILCSYFFEQTIDLQKHKSYNILDNAIILLKNNLLYIEVKI